MIKRFLPKNESFFEHFTAHSSLIVEAASELTGLCKNPEQCKRYAATISQLEERADAVTRKVIKELARSFVTPFDREDIHTLITSLDDVIDFIANAAASYVNFEVRQPIPEYQQQVALLQEATELLSSSIKSLDSAKAHTRIRASMNKVHELENRADAVHSGALARMFKEYEDSREIFKWQHLTHALEGSINACQQAAHTVSLVILKSS